MFSYRLNQKSHNAKHKTYSYSEPSVSSPAVGLGLVSIISG